MMSFNLDETFTGTRVEPQVVCLEDDEDLENNIILVFPGTSNRCLQPPLLQTLVSSNRRHAVFTF